MALVISSKVLQAQSQGLLQKTLQRSAHRGHSNRALLPSRNTIKSTCDNSSLKKQLISTAAAPNQERNAARVITNPIVWYARKLDTNPLLTKCITSAFIAGSGDLVCQYLMHCQKKQNGVENYGALNDSFDPDMKRTGRFAFLGLTFVAPMCHNWFAFLNRRVSGSSFMAAFKRVVLDQIIFAPFMIPSIMTNLMLLEGRSTTEIKDKLIRDVPDAYITNIFVWIPYHDESYAARGSFYHRNQR